MTEQQATAVDVSGIGFQPGLPVPDRDTYCGTGVVVLNNYVCGEYQGGGYY